MQRYTKGLTQTMNWTVKLNFLTHFRKVNVMVMSKAIKQQRQNLKRNLFDFKSNYF